MSPDHARRRIHLPWRTFRSWLAYGSVPLVGLATAPLLARALGPEGRGQLAGALQPLTVADAIAAIGVPAALTYFIAKGVPISRLRPPALLLLAASSISVYIALALYSNVVSSKLQIPQLALILLWSSIFAGVYFAYRRAIFQGRQDYGVLDADRSLGAGVRLLAMVALFAIGITSAGFYMYGYIMAGIIASGLVLLTRKPSTSAPKNSYPYSASNFVRFALLSSASTIAVALNNRLDQAVLPGALNAADLGFYSVAVTVAEVPLIPTIVLARNLLAEKSAHEDGKVIRRTVALGLGAVFVAAITLALIAPVAVPIAFGEAFNPSVPVTQILLLGTVLSSIATTISVYTTALGSAGLASVGPALGAIATVAGLVIFWTIMTPTVAAWLTVAAQGASVLSSATALVIVMHRRRRI